MRFCPFCSAENAQETSECSACGRRLPPLSKRRRKNSSARLVAVRPVDVITKNSDVAPSPMQGAQTGGMISKLPIRNGLSSENDAVGAPHIELVEGASTQSISTNGKVSSVERQPTANTGIVAEGQVHAILERVGIEEWSTTVITPALDRGDWTEQDWTEEVGPLKSYRSGGHKASERDSAALIAMQRRDGDATETDSLLSVAPRSSDWNQVAATEKPQEGQGAWAAEIPGVGRQSRPFVAPDVRPIPRVPEAGAWPAAKYAISFGRAHWQRRGAIKYLRSQIGFDTDALDGILAVLGRQARILQIDTPSMGPENRAIDEAEERRKTADHECSGLSKCQAEENSEFSNAELKLSGRVADSSQALEVAQGELGRLDAEFRVWKDKRKRVENRHKGYLKAVDNRFAEADKPGNVAERDEIRQAAEEMKLEAAALQRECKNIEASLYGLEAPIIQKKARIEALKSDLDASKRALAALRDGHRRRLSEIEAEQGRKSRELAQAEAEIRRRWVTLGTIVNLNRMERDEFVELYAQVDTLRGTIGARSNEMDKLISERYAFDRSSLVRGCFALVGSTLVLILVLAIFVSAC